MFLNEFDLPDRNLTRLDWSAIRSTLVVLRTCSQNMVQMLAKNLEKNKYNKYLLFFSRKVLFLFI